jgi:tetratricopeptide repeat protein 30
MRLFSCIFLLLTINKSFANNVIIKPSFFTIHSCNGKDWMYQEKVINVFGFGISSFINNENWKLTFDYLQIGLLGNVNQDIYNFLFEGSFTKVIYGMIRDQMYIEAITALNYQLQMFPRSRAAISLLAYCYYHIQDYVQAVTHYEQLTKFCPYVTEYKIYYAQALFKAGRYADAIKQSLRVDGEQHQHRMIKLRAQIKYEQEDLAGCKALADQCLPDDADAIVTQACIDYKEKKYEQAKKKFVDASNQLGYQPDLAYNIALCFYQLKAYGQSLKNIAEIIERGVREHPELSVGSNTDAGNVRSVGNSNVLRETALIEAFNLKAAIEYSLKNLEPAKMALNDMPPRAEEELDAVTLHNQALINIETATDSGFRKLNFLLHNPPFPPPIKHKLPSVPLPMHIL